MEIKIVNPDGTTQIHKIKKTKKKSDFIYLCREERHGRNGNLRSLRKAKMTPDVVRTYFWGFIKKYWRELIGVK